MTIFNEEGLIDSDVQDVLYELGNVGLGSASITIGRLMGIRLHIGVPKIVPTDEELAKKLVDFNGKIGVMMKFQKTLKGAMLIILKEEFLDNVVEKMTENEGVNCDEAERLSAVQEFANIVCAAYLKAVGQYTDMRIYVKPAGINDITESDIVTKCHKAICIDTGFNVIYENGDILDDVGRVVMLPDEESVEKLITPLCDE